MKRYRPSSIKVNGRRFTIEPEVFRSRPRPFRRVQVYEGERLEQSMSPVEAERLGRALIDAARAARGMR